MDPKDKRLKQVMNFTVKSLRLEQDQWQLSFSDDDNKLTVERFLAGQNHSWLFIYRAPEHDPQTRPVPAAEPLEAETVLRFSLSFPQDVSSKVVCVENPSGEAVTKDSAKNLVLTERPGNDPLGLLPAVIDQVPVRLFIILIR